MDEPKVPRVLVVEDDAAIRWLLRALVRKQGLTCDAVEDGQQADAVGRANAGCNRSLHTWRRA